MDETKIVAKRVVNAFIASAELRFPVDQEVGIALRFFKARNRGLWVGGTMHLLPDRLDFRPDALNRFTHKGDMSRCISLADIASVTDHLGVATRIVIVALRDGTEFKFRCYGAAEFADQIREAQSAANRNSAAPLRALSVPQQSQQSPARYRTRLTNPTIERAPETQAGCGFA